MTAPKQRVNPDGPATYQITVLGHLNESWSSWFNDMTITYDSEGDDRPTSTLTGPVADQSALRGIMAKIWDLNLVLIAATRIGHDSKLLIQNKD